MLRLVNAHDDTKKKTRNVLQRKEEVHNGVAIVVFKVTS